jgi:hypothetical protein
LHYLLQQQPEDLLLRQLQVRIDLRHRCRHQPDDLARREVSQAVSLASSVMAGIVPWPF